MCKPNGSLAYPQLASSLIKHDTEVRIFDACVGSEKDNLAEIFKNPTKLETGLWRTGVSDERILEEVADADIVGLTSLFTDQETMVLRTTRLIKCAFPKKLIIAGGVNARARRGRFLANGVDVVCLSEADLTITKIVEVFRTGEDLSGINGTTTRGPAGNIIETRTAHEDIPWELDRLPIPAWHLLPLERYWKVARPHGGRVRPPGEEHRYGMMMTSLGCAFSCTYCHIAGETTGSLFGAIGKYRVKSIERILQELEVLKRLGVTHVFLEDDMLFGHKDRMIRVLREIRGIGVEVSDVNGLNVVHMFRRVGHGKNYEPDTNVVEALREANFKDIVLAFESATPHILRKYATNKWDPENHPVPGLIRLTKSAGLTVGGNYMLGWPGETREEMEATINLARSHRDAGIDWCNFYAVMPLPGTPLFDEAIRDGPIDPDFNPDTMNWTRANMQTSVSREELEDIRQQAWLEINPQDFQKYKKEMVAAYN